MEELYGGRRRNESAFWMCIWQMNIWIPPEISKTLLPNLPTNAIETSMDKTRAAPIKAEE